jgi:hypothetical protein
MNSFTKKQIVNFILLIPLRALFQGWSAFATRLGERQAPHSRLKHMHLTHLALKIKLLEHLGRKKMYDPEVGYQYSMLTISRQYNGFDLMIYSYFKIGSPAFYLNLFSLKLVTTLSSFQSFS